MEFRHDFFSGAGERSEWVLKTGNINRSCRGSQSGQTAAMRLQFGCQSRLSKQDTARLPSHHALGAREGGPSRQSAGMKTKKSIFILPFLLLISPACTHFMIESLQWPPHCRPTSRWSPSNWRRVFFLLQSVDTETDCIHPSIMHWPICQFINLSTHLTSRCLSRSRETLQLDYTHKPTSVFGKRKRPSEEKEGSMTSKKE